MTWVAFRNNVFGAQSGGLAHSWEDEQTDEDSGVEETQN